MLLRIEPEQARQAANQIDQVAETMAQEMNLLQTAMNQLALGWDAPGSAAFIQALQSVIHQITASRDEAHSLSHRLVGFVEKWEEVDRQGVHPGEGDTPLLHSFKVPPTYGPVEEGKEGKQAKPDRQDHTPETTIEDAEPSSEPVSTANPGTTATGSQNSNPLANQPAKPPANPGIPNRPGMAAGVTMAGAALVSPSLDRNHTTQTGQMTEGEGAASDQEKTIPPSMSGGWSNVLTQLEQTNAEIAKLEQLPVRGPLDEHQLRASYEQRTQLEGIIAEGIPANGRDPAKNPFPEGECTWFATSKRDLFPAVTGDAKYWAERAATSGLEVGNIPIKGSVMVWQPGVFKAHEVHGHVSFVESVERLSDGTFKVFYTDNLNPETVRSVIVSETIEGVDFIY